MKSHNKQTGHSLHTYLCTHVVPPQRTFRIFDSMALSFLANASFSARTWRGQRGENVSVVEGAGGRRRHALCGQRGAGEASCFTDEELSETRNCAPVGVMTAREQGSKLSQREKSQPGD